MGLLWLRLGGLAVVLLVAQVATAATFCPDWSAYCYTRRMDMACSAGAQQSTEHVAYTWPNGRAFDGEGPFGCGTGHLLHQYEYQVATADEGEDVQMALWLNIKVRGGGRLLTSCQTQWAAGNLHQEQTVVCASGGEWVSVTIHPAE